MTGADLKRLREEAGVSIRQLAKWLARRGLTAPGGHELDGWRLNRMERGELQISQRVAETIKSLIEDEQKWRS